MGNWPHWLPEEKIFNLHVCLEELLIVLQHVEFQRQCLPTECSYGVHTMGWKNGLCAENRIADFVDVELSNLDFDWNVN